MQHLILRPGPELVLRAHRPEPGDLGPCADEVDIAERAHEFLFEAVTLHPDTTLGDVVRLLDANELLRQIYRPLFADELCAEARKGALDDAAARAMREDIEFLELYAHWGLNPRTDEYSSACWLLLHGVGPVLQEDRPDVLKRRDERIEWSLSLTPLRHLLGLPLRVKAQLRITEDDPAASPRRLAVRHARLAEVTLGQVLHGLLWELSFHGGPIGQRDGAGSAEPLLQPPPP